MIDSNVLALMAQFQNILMLNWHPAGLHFRAVLFLMYIHDISSDVHNVSLRLFADYTKLFISGNTKL